jgi:hypothetical protein
MTAGMSAALMVPSSKIAWRATCCASATDKPLKFSINMSSARRSALTVSRGCASTHW